MLELARKPKFEVLWKKAIALIFIVAAFIALSYVDAFSFDEYEHIKIGMPREINSVNPLGYSLLHRAELNIQMCFYDHLFRRTENDTVVGHLAKKFKWIDSRTFRVNLHQGVKFHDGEELTSKDVKWSIEEMINPRKKIVFVTVLNSIQEIKLIDKYTIDFITAFPDPILPAKLTCYSMIVSSKMQSNRRSEEHEEIPMGTGPFKFVEWIKGKHLIAERNEDYFLGVPKIKKITFYPIPDNYTRATALRSGDIDIAVDIDPSYVKDLEDTPGIQVTKVPSSRVEWVWIRSDIKPFNDKRFRQALNFAVDKVAFVKTVQKEYGLPIGQPCPPYFFGHNSDIGVYEFNPKKSRKLIDEIGLPQNFEIEYEAFSIDEERARAVVRYLEAVGLKVKLKIKEPSAAYADLLERRAKPLFHFNWGNWNLLDIEGTLADCFGCTDKENGIGRWSYYCNAKIEGIIKDIRTNDVQRRAVMALEASRILHEDAAAIWLYSHYDIHGKRQGIPEFKARKDNTICLTWIKDKN